MMHHRWDIAGWPETNGQVMINNHTTVGAWSGGVELNGMWFRCLVFKEMKPRKGELGVMTRCWKDVYTSVSYSFKCDGLYIFLMIGLAEGEVISYCKVA